MKENINRCEEDEIDLKELWKTLMKRKSIIVVITLLITIVAIVYTLVAKPIYSGSVMIEVGEVVNNDEQKTRFFLDNIYNLKSIIEKSLEEEEEEVKITIPKKTNNILLIFCSSGDKGTIKTNLTSSINYILKRHEEKAKLYKSGNTKIRLSGVVGKITVTDKAVKPKKILIVVVAFITGLIFSIFLVFFLEFIRGVKKEGVE